QVPHLLRARLPHLVDVLVEVLAGGVLRVLEVVEPLPALLRDLHRRLDGVVGDRVEVHVGEVQALLGAVEDPLPGEVAVEVHLPQTDRVGLPVALGDGRHGLDVGGVRDGGEAADRGGDGLREVRRVHRLGDVQRAQVAGDVPAQLVVGQVDVHRRGGRDLQDLRAQVRVRDLAGDG